MSNVLRWDIWAPIMRAKREKPEPDSLLIAAAENARIAANAERASAAMDRLAHIPSDTNGD